MNQLICPKCGSKYLLLDKRNPATAFTATSCSDITFIVTEEETGQQPRKEELQQEEIFCGACAWHGYCPELHISDLE